MGGYGFYKGPWTLKTLLPPWHLSLSHPQRRTRPAWNHFHTEDVIRKGAKEVVEFLRSLWFRGLVENCVVYGDRGIRDFFEIKERTMRRIWQNLFWAFFSNAISGSCWQKTITSFTKRGLSSSYTAVISTFPSGRKKGCLSRFSKVGYLLRKPMCKAYG